MRIEPRVKGIIKETSLMSPTFTSHIAHRLGSALIGSPESMSMPDDYYFEKFDREKPTADEIKTPQEQLVRLSTTAFRIDHTWRLCKLVTTLWAVLMAVLLVVFGLYAGGASVWNHHEANVQAAKNQAIFHLQSRCAALTNEQQQADSDCADLQAQQKAQLEAQQKAYWQNFCASLPDDAHRARSPQCNGSVEH